MALQTPHAQVRPRWRKPLRPLPRPPLRESMAAFGFGFRLLREEENREGVGMTLSCAYSGRLLALLLRLQATHQRIEMFGLALNAV